MMIFWQVLFGLCLAGAAYWVNWKVKFSVTTEELFGVPVPQLIVDVFLGGVFVMWLLQLFGVGK